VWKINHTLIARSAIFLKISFFDEERVSTILLIDKLTDIPTMNKKNGITKSAKCMPSLLS
jgi:hypothetical protein